MADSPSSRTGSRPRIILGESWEGEAPASKPMDWRAQFGRRSPLARKIITFNLIALCMLVAGILYLNQFQGGLVSLRERSLQTEGKMISAAVQRAIEGQPLTAEGLPVALEAVLPLATATVSQVRVYGADGQLLGLEVPASVNDPDALEAQQLDTPRPSALTAILNEVWERFARLIIRRTKPLDEELGINFLNPLAAEAIMARDARAQQFSTEEGQRIMAVASPILLGDQVLGAVVVSTQAGDLDAFVRGEREQILQVFALAMISSILLSFALANTIVGPLRDLAEAAEKGGAQNSKRVNPERIQIPDMTARPDEIGYLSGAMKSMTAALYDRIEANESFAADVSHEIKNPLTSLRSAVETMPYAKNDEARGRLLKVIQVDVDRLDRLVTDISNASRLDSELVRAEREMFDLHQLLRNLTEFNGENAEKRGASLVSEVEDAPLMVQGLEGRLAQVFVNLITNAISFSGEGDRVTVKTRQSEHHVHVLVEDTGPGIPDDNLDDVFSRFYSERPEEAFGDHSGLGLAISRQIVEAHDGRIWAENIRAAGVGLDTSPDGARFVVELPL